MKPTNDNIKVVFKDMQCSVLTTGMSIAFNKLYEADTFVQEYYEREL